MQGGCQGVGGFGGDRENEEGNRKWKYRMWDAAIARSGNRLLDSRTGFAVIGGPLLEPAVVRAPSCLSA